MLLSRNRKVAIKKIITIITLTISVVMMSCASKAQKRRNAVEEMFDESNFAGIIEHIKQNQSQYGETNAFLYNMDLGVLFHYIEEWDSSNVYLQRAADIYTELVTRSVSNEAAAVLTNDNVRPYRARPYEIVMLHQLKAFNFMAQGQFDDAAVEARRLQIHFNEWERTRAAQGQYHTDGLAHLMSSLSFEATNEVDGSLISLFHSVRGFQEGPIALAPEIEGFAYNRLTAGDRADDIDILKISPNTEDNAWTAAMGETEVIIIGYAGKGPNMNELTWRGQWTSGGDLRIQVPSRAGGRPTTFHMLAPPLPSDNDRREVTSVNVTMSLPDVQTFHSRTSHFSAGIDGSSDRFYSVLTNNFDAQAWRAFEEEWAATVARTVVRVVLRTIANENVQARINTGNPGLNMVARLATDIASDQMEKADIRMVFLLPKQIHVTRFPVEPGMHNIHFNTYDVDGRVIGRHTFENVEVRRGQKRVLFHRSLQ